MQTIREIESFGRNGLAIQANMADPNDLDQLIANITAALGGLIYWSIMQEPLLVIHIF